MKKTIYGSLRLLFVFMIATACSFAQERAATPDDAASNVVFDTPVLAYPSMAKASMVEGDCQWSSGTKIPVPKKYHTVASYNGEIYIFGGVTTGNTYNAKSYKYTPATKTWTPIADYPIGRFLFGTAHEVKGKIYIMAGLDNIGSGYKTVPDVYEYDPVANTYTKKRNMPVSQGYCGSGVIDNKIYLIAGSGSSNTTYITTVQVYDPETDTYSLSTDYPRNVRYLGCATVNNKIIVTGGYNATFTPSTYVPDTYVGEIVGGNLKWTKVKDYPIGAAIYVSGVAVGDNAYFFGGRPSIDKNAPATERSFRYTPSTDTWETLEFKITGMQTMTQAGTDGQKVYAPGGEDRLAAALDVMEVLDPAVTGGPVAYLKTTAIDKWMKRSVPVSTIVELKSKGIADLTWNATIDPSASSWLSMKKLSGTIQPGILDTLFVDINATGLADGDHNGTITFSTNASCNTIVTTNITIHVQEQDVDEDPIVLLEEGTGNWCGYCPYAVDVYKAIESKYPGRLVVMAYHGGSATEPMQTAHTSVWTQQTGLTGWPQGTINRIKFEGSSVLALNRGEWDARVTEILQTRRSPVALKVISKSYNQSTKRIDMEIEVFFHRRLDLPIRLNIVQLQDSMNWRQTYYPPSGGTQYLFPYWHNHTVRQIIPNDFGEIISAGGAIASQTSIRKSFSFTSVDSTIKLSHLVIYAHTSNGQTFGEVLQSMELPLSQLITSVEDQPAVNDFALAQNYPNPFNPSTRITYDVANRSSVTLVVTDIFGRQIRTLVNEVKDPGRYYSDFNAAGLASGTYIITMRAGKFVQTRTMTLMK